MKVLVIGGAGYIGSHMVKLLSNQGCTVTTLDDLSSGHRNAVLRGDFVQGDFGDQFVLNGRPCKTPATRMNARDLG